MLTSTSTHVQLQEHSEIATRNGEVSDGMMDVDAPNIDAMQLKVRFTLYLLLKKECCS